MPQVNRSRGSGFSCIVERAGAEAKRPPAHGQDQEVKLTARPVGLLREYQIANTVSQNHRFVV